MLVILALLLRKKPEVLVQQAATVRTQFQGPDKLHTLTWAYGQVGWFSCRAVDNANVFLFEICC